MRSRSIMQCYAQYQSTKISSIYTHQSESPFKEQEAVAQWERGLFGTDRRPVRIRARTELFERESDNCLAEKVV